ncbi:LGFP repeat-containing protein [Gordonia phthalatica]|uniref:LGFP repeat-containing protein n=1 Tax=Gordonia phthalatica TaxID=1136941 RepID=A0A0N9NEF9_9ACTN|nr:hypothetical protein [Gordonia phthalatica]ALG86070.1 hypothetical protein ACH46_18155 [Gordonia phthalatica]
MNHVARRVAGVVAAASLTATVVVGCSSNDSDDAASASSGTVAATATDGATSTDGADASGDKTGETGANAGESVELTAADGSKVTLKGAIAKKYSSATEKQKKDLGKPLTGEKGSGTSANGVIFQQFDGGVITAKNADATAYITWGKIRDAWNVKRDETGQPAADGKSGSEGPLGTATSDETDEGDLKVSTFENGKITFSPKTDKVEVTVKDKVVPAK